MAVKKAKAAPAQQPVFGHSIFVIIALELLAVGLFTLLAGISDNFGTLVVIFMVAMWLIYVMANAKVVSTLGGALGKVANQNAV